MKTGNNLMCPKCAGTNIKPIGIYFQCKSERDGSVKSCGFIGSKQDFMITLDNINRK